ncbi:hypothetical protein XANCAGTX0491_007974 [Xanthoria calcicola]
MFLFSAVLVFFLFIAIVRSAVEPAPIVVATTGKFAGNDGSWSTFNFSVGTPLQTLEVLPSTQVPESWIVLDVACSTSPADCSDIRGGTFAYQDSSSWTTKSFFALGAEANLGYTNEENRGFYGWELVQLTTPEGANTRVNQSVVAGISTKNFFLGVLGLAARPVVWEDHSDSSPSLITILKEQNYIPNRSYGYTAGASYNNAPGSLTIGGYDTSRLKPNDVSFGFSSQTARQLLVSVQAISVTNSKGPEQLLTGGISALIDSTVPHIWLPTAACRAFEDAFGIEYDPISNLYLVNDDQHDAMVKQNAEVTIKLGTSLNGGSTVSITLPYASFDLETGPPFAKSQSKYFPLRRAKDETQYTLGRTFLQEAFIIVDYDHNRFSISQAQYSQGQPSNITVTSVRDSGNSETNNSTPESPPPLNQISSQKSGGGIGTGAIVGIVVAIIILALLAGAYCLWRFKFKKSWKSSKSKDNIKDKAELEGDSGDSGNSEPKGIVEAYNKRRPSQESSHESKEAAKFHGNEGMAETPLAAELEGAGPFGGPSTRSRSMEHLGGMAELPSPDPFRPELESPGLGIRRSELSTPEPPSELSTSDRNLVPEMTSGGLAHELTSRELAHELPTSNRNSRGRPISYRQDSLDSDIISPHDSASIRPRLRERKDSNDNTPTAAPPSPQRPPLRLGSRRQNSRPQHFRLKSSSSLDTFQTRWDQPAPTPPGGNTPSLPPPHPMEPYGTKSSSSRHPQGSPSPLGSPPLGSQASPSLSALNSPTFPSSSTQRVVDNEPETDPLMHRSQPQGSPRSTRFAENFTNDPEATTGEETERQRRDEAERRLVRAEVGKLEDRVRRDGM